MPPSIFKAAMCSQCGGSLDLTGLKCPSCGTNFMIDWKEVEVAYTEETQIPDSQARRIDALLLAAWQRASIENGAPILVTFVQADNLSIINLFGLGGQEEKGWLRIAQISHEQNNRSYQLRVGDLDNVASPHLNWPTKDYDLTWLRAVGTDGVIYTLEESNYSSSLRNFLGEEPLFTSGILKEAVAFSFKWILPLPKPEPKPIKRSSVPWGRHIITFQN